MKANPNNDSDSDDENLGDTKVSFDDTENLEKRKTKGTVLLYGVADMPSVLETIIYGLQVSSI